MKKYLMILAAAFSLWACDKSETEIPAVDPDNSELYPVSITSSFANSSYETGSEVIPMSRAGEDEVMFIMNNGYHCIILKDVNGQWIIDRILNPTFKKASGSSWTRCDIHKGDESDPLEIELRQGKYRMLVMFNANMANFNNSLYEGMIIDENNPPYAVKYTIPAPSSGSIDNQYGNAGHHVIYGEIFTTFTEFEIAKTDSLASGKYPRNIDLVADRRVAKFRVMAKAMSTESEFPERYDYKDKPVEELFFASYTLKATDPKKPFCQGIDLWNKAWYGDGEDLTSIDVSQSFTRFKGFQSEAGDWYIVPVNPSHRTYNPYYFVDPEDKQGTPIRIEDYLFNYVSGMPDYISLDTYESVLINNEITGVVFEEIEGFDPGMHAYYLQVLPGENVKQIFPDYFEFNVND